VVQEVLAVEDLAGGADATQFTVTELFARTGTAEPLRWSGQVPTRLQRAFRQAGIDLHTLLPTERLTNGRRS
jgi:pilus assembly protein CpaF